MKVSTALRKRRYLINDGEYPRPATGIQGRFILLEQARSRDRERPNTCYLHKS